MTDGRCKHCGMTHEPWVLVCPTTRRALREPEGRGPSGVQRAIPPAPAIPRPSAQMRAARTSPAPTPATPVRAVRTRPARPTSRLTAATALSSIVSSVVVPVMVCAICRVSSTVKSSLVSVETKRPFLSRAMTSVVAFVVLALRER